MGSMQLVFLGGVGHAGGNKIVVQPARGPGILLDFGWDFTVDTQSLNAFVRSRDYRALVDLIKIGMLPRPTGPLQGVYRRDLATYYAQELCQRLALCADDLTRQPNVGHVLISHAHADHVGLIQYLHDSIKIHGGATTRLVLEYYEDVFPPGSMFTGILSYRPLFQISSTGARRSSGFDEISRPYTALDVSRRDGVRWTALGGDSSCEVAFFETDHSMPGAGAFLLRDTVSGAKIVYTGDIRFHGPFAKRVSDFIAAAADFHPDALICEGTAVGTDKAGPEVLTEEDVTMAVTKTLKEANPSQMVFVEFGPRDIWRVISIYRAAKAAGRTLVLQARSYHLLQVLVRANAAGSEDVNLHDLRVLLSRKGWGMYGAQDNSHAMDIQAGFQPPGAKGEVDRTPKYGSLRIDDARAIRAAEIQFAPGRFLVQAGPYQWSDLVDLAPPPGASYIWTKSDPVGEEGEDVVQQRETWLKMLGIPPDRQFTAHCSGHARVPDLVRAINAIKPKVLYPVHTEHPEMFPALGIEPGITITLPMLETPYEVGDKTSRVPVSGTPSPDNKIHSQDIPLARGVDYVITMVQPGPAKEDTQTASVAPKPVTLEAPEYDAVFALGIQHLRAGTLTQAIAALEKAVSLDPMRAEAWEKLGEARYEQGDTAGANLAFQRRAELDLAANLGGESVPKKKAPKKRAKRPAKGQ